MNFFFSLKTFVLTSICLFSWPCSISCLFKNSIISLVGGQRSTTLSVSNVDVKVTLYSFSVLRAPFGVPADNYVANLILPLLLTFHILVRCPKCLTLDLLSYFGLSKFLILHMLMNVLDYLLGLPCYWRWHFH